jgi:hypothetical protein
MATDFVLYVCWWCGRTIKWPNPSTSSPNTTCGPHTDENGATFMAYMARMSQPESREETER